MSVRVKKRIGKTPFNKFLAPACGGEKPRSGVSKYEDKTRINRIGTERLIHSCQTSWEIISIPAAPTSTAINTIREEFILRTQKKTKKIFASNETRQRFHTQLKIAADTSNTLALAVVYAVCRRALWGTLAHKEESKRVQNGKQNKGKHR